MALTPSNMLPLGTKAPDFNLFDALTKTYQSLNTSKSEHATVIMFLCVLAQTRFDSPRFLRSGCQVKFSK